MVIYQPVYACWGEDEHVRRGYYPYMYLPRSTGLVRRPWGLRYPKKIAYIVRQEHGGKEDDGYGGSERLLQLPDGASPLPDHTATGRTNRPSFHEPKLHGNPRYGSHEPPSITDPTLPTTKWDLTYLPSDEAKATVEAMGRPQTQGQHRFQLKPELILTASARAIRSWALTATPFDNLGAMDAGSRSASA